MGYATGAGPVTARALKKRLKDEGWEYQGTSSSGRETWKLFRENKLVHFRAHGQEVGYQTARDVYRAAGWRWETHPEPPKAKTPALERAEAAFNPIPIAPAAMPPSPPAAPIKDEIDLEPMPKQEPAPMAAKKEERAPINHRLASRGRRYTDDEILTVLLDVEELGMEVAMKKHWINKTTIQRWKADIGLAKDDEGTQTAEAQPVTVNRPSLAALMAADRPANSNQALADTNQQEEKSKMQQQEEKPPAQGDSTRAKKKDRYHAPYERRRIAQYAHENGVDAACEKYFMSPERVRSYCEECPRETVGMHAFNNSKRIQLPELGRKQAALFSYVHGTDATMEKYGIARTTVYAFRRDYPEHLFSVADCDAVKASQPIQESKQMKPFDVAKIAGKPASTPVAVAPAGGGGSAEKPKPSTAVLQLMQRLDEPNNALLKARIQTLEEENAKLKQENAQMKVDNEMLIQLIQKKLNIAAAV